LQALEAPVEAWFKPLAYALILLRENGVPSVFYPDLFGASYDDTGGDGETYHIDMPVIEQLHELILARQRFAHGVQTLFLTILTASPSAAAARKTIPAAWW
jgi:alpha-amylase